MAALNLMNCHLIVVVVSNPVAQTLLATQENLGLFHFNYLVQSFRQNSLLKMVCKVPVALAREMNANVKEPSTAEDSYL